MVIKLKNIIKKTIIAGFRYVAISTHQWVKHHSAGRTTVLHPEQKPLEPFSFSSTESSSAFQTSSIHYPLKNTTEHGQRVITMLGALKTNGTSEVVLTDSKKTAKLEGMTSPSKFYLKACNFQLSGESWSHGSPSPPALIQHACTRAQTGRH